MSKRGRYDGPALLSSGFRPFFLVSILFAAIVIPVWWFVWTGRTSLAGPFTPADWHVHEMVYGYGAAVLAGFLFTAVPNWTGRLPTRGWPLMSLLSLWFAGRISVAGLIALPASVTAAVDQSFLLAVTLMIAREIVAGRNWRNLKVLMPVALLWLLNVLFHAEAIASGTADFGRRAGMGVLIFMIMLIGGRILPSFTRNWLAARGHERLPVPFNSFDVLCLATGAVALVAWVVAADTWTYAALAFLAAGLHLVRLGRWQGTATAKSPLLLMLHLAYLFIPLGFFGTALATCGVAHPAVGPHLWGISAIGGMTCAVMMRATMGHTGRQLNAGPMLTSAFLLVVGAGAARVADPSISAHGVDGATLAVVLWTLAFAVMATVLFPWLVLPKSDTPRKANVT
ncbi:NnrS family protein [Silicimonas algicola]|uniref:Uncharacterized protein involved in response to NO n=1 Tax=Silicimonas algicola TaxID=1826607 RepID=A0A316GDM3_9RHOB|nr:NnrS family protein [Silicimonas algicola]AZQ67598.1 NnrS family protein [Silicimonas algicola]PWK52757.1 uncharacterized protein involved in response to NO [Silicimonas algicola]